MCVYYLLNNNYGVCVLWCVYVLQGICVDGEENIQEILTKRLVLCQYLCALMILRTGIASKQPTQVSYM